MSKQDAVATLITIERITARTSKASNKPYWSAQSGGEYYNIWDTMIKDRLVEGDTYNLMIESNTSGDRVFHNIVGLAPLPGFADIDAELESISVSPKPTPAPIPKPVVTSPVQQDPMIDVRKTALIAANTLLAHEIVTMKGFNEVLRKYESYIRNGLGSEQLISSESMATPDIKEFVANE